MKSRLCTDSKLAQALMRHFVIATYKHKIVAVISSYAPSTIPADKIKRPWPFEVGYRTPHLIEMVAARPSLRKEGKKTKRSV